MLALPVATPVRASGDYCEPGWTLDFAVKPECDNVAAALVPGNDTRANLVLLMADRRGAPASAAPVPKPLLAWRDFRTRFYELAAAEASTYASGEGSRCRSDGDGAKSFSAAVEAASGLLPDERKSLLAARADHMPQCEAGANAAGLGSLPPAAEVPADVTSAEGHAFAAYLHGVSAFYAGQFDEAAKSFEGLRSDPDPWLGDTAAYMVARTLVNELQVGAFDEYGTFKGSTAVDKTAARGAATNLDAYIRDHPNGRYAASARGLQRRVAWLAGWTEDLAARYAALIAQPAAARGLDDVSLAEEIDSKLLPLLTPAMTRDPILLATLDLRAMRGATPGTPKAPRPDLAAQRDALAAVPGLYEFLEATEAFYGDRDARSVIGSVPDDTRRRGGDHLWFSRQLLRGLALEAADDHNARGFWKELLPGTTRPLDSSTTELALALDDERHGDLDDSFATGSALKDPGMRKILLIHDAGPNLLRSRAGDAAASTRERQVALFTLLLKEVTGGLYGNFLVDAARVPADAPTKGSVELDPLGDGDVPLGLFVRGETEGDIGCPVLTTTAAHLSRNPDGVRDRLCLAEWLRLNGFDPEHYAKPQTKGELGTGPSTFPGALLTRSAVYRAVIVARTVSADNRAYALYRAVKCYEPSGYNGCGGLDAPKAERRRWYDALKRDYPDSRWAKRLSYWW